MSLYKEELKEILSDGLSSVSPVKYVWRHTPKWTQLELATSKK